MTLTPQQRAAAESSAPRIVCNACAGSGKTSVLVERAAWLIGQQGVSAEDVLVVTFTRKAAREIKERLASTVPHSCDGIWVDTFHGVGMRILRGATDRPLSLVTPEESDRLFDRVCKDLCLPADAVRKAKKMRKEASETGVLPVVGQRLVLMAYREFDSRMARMGAIDYGGILTQVLTMMAFMNRRSVPFFRHILVDEAQDCDPLQWRFISMLESDARCESLFVVGDPNQTIYGWRGSDGELMQNLEGAEVHRMDHTFRCGEAISCAATSVIAPIENYEASSIVTCKNRDDVVKGRRTCGADEEDVLWCGFAAQLGETAFLSRTNRGADIVQQSLEASDVKVYRAGQVSRITHTKAYRTAWCMMALAHNHGNDLAFDVAVDCGVLVIDPDVLAIVKANAARKGKALFDTYLATVNDQTVGRYLIEKKIAETNVEGVFKLVGFPEDALVLLMQSVRPSDPARKLLEAMETLDDGEEVQPEDTVYVGTIHVAKGLEFDNVCVCHCDDGMRMDDDNRRVLYVAMTRARSHLMLQWSSEEPAEFVKEVSFAAIS